MTARIVVATAGRVLRQLLGDRRTVALLLVVPGALLALTHQMIDARPTFDRLALSLLGVFPFTTMFLITSVAMPDRSEMARSCSSISALAGASPSRPPRISAGTRRLERWEPSS